MGLAIPRLPPEKIRALLEVLICSGFPTQLLIAGLLWAFGLSPRASDGQLSLLFVGLLSLADAVLLVTLVFVFLVAGGERPREVLLGTRRVGRETVRGLMMVPVSFAIAVTVLVVARALVPWLHNVDVNPFQGMLQTTRDRLIAAVVVTIAGGLREEIQRAFILHRFDRHLGGGWLGLALFSASFGIGHLEQGRDVALATAALGAYWGATYLLRRSIVSPAVAHAGFNLSEILRHSLRG